MRISVHKGEGLARRMVIELPKDDIYQEVEKRLKALTNTVRINGFRPGKVPIKLVRTRYAGKIQQEVFEELITSSFHQAIAQEQLHPAGTPIIEKNTEQESTQSHFSYTAIFEVLPDIVLVPLDSYTVYRPMAEVLDTDIDAMLEHFRQQRCTWMTVQRPAQLRDQLLVSFQTGISGAPADKKTFENLKLVLGANVMPAEVETGLIGASAGEACSIEASVNELTVIFNVTIHEVLEPVLPVLDREFVKSFGVASGDIAVLRNDVRKNMTLKLTEQIRNNIKWQVMNILLDAHPIQLPGVLVDRERTILLEDARQESGAELSLQWAEEQAKRRVALRLIIGEIVHKNAIVVDMARVQHTIQDIAASYEDPDEVLLHYRTAATRKAIENMVLEDQAIDLILPQIQVKIVPSSFQEVMSSETFSQFNK